VNQVRLNYDKFTPEQQLKLSKALIPPVTDRNVVTPRGWFRVNYDTSGQNALGYSLQLLLEALDSAYSFQVLHLGYPPPRPSTPGSSYYDIYVQSISDYGYTEFDNSLNSYIVIDNDFTHTPTRGINGARVTVAHELHHAIQIGNYTFRDQDRFFHELSSTAMEEFVFDSINDYYFYMRDFFRYPDLSFPSHSGYDLAIWNIYLAQIFDFKILKRQWELFTQMRAMDAIARSIAERNDSFQDIFNRFGIWTYYTNYRKIPGKYFEEGDKYPAVSHTMRMQFTPPQDTLILNAEPVTLNYLTLNVLTGGRNDTVTVLISNSDYKKSISSPTSTEEAVYEFSIDSTAGLTKLTEGYFQRFTAPNNVFWSTSEFINNQLVREGFIRIESEAPYPNPFRYSAHNSISIPLSSANGSEVELSIFSASMDLVYNSAKTIELKFGKELISWNGKSSDNQKLGSGIYIYVIKSGDDILKGKIVIFND
jgi:hypothetical protein